MTGPVRCPEPTVFVVVLASLALAGCPSEPEPEPEPSEPVALIRGDDWVRVTDPGGDTFADQRPADAMCDDLGWFIDPFAHSIDVTTTMCNYPTFAQPTLDAVAAGDTIDVVFYHDELSTDFAGAVGYLALAIDGQIIWEWTVPIPTNDTVAPALIEESFTIEHSFPAGAEMQFHVHNHGPNSWELFSVEVTHQP